MWRRLALIGVSLVVLAVAFWLRMRDLDSQLASLFWIFLPGVVVVAWGMWFSFRRQAADVASAVRELGGSGGVPCCRPLDPPAWGSLVVTPDAFAWEPNKRAVEHGQSRVTVVMAAQLPIAFGTCRVGVRNLPSVTFTEPNGQELTLATSPRSAARLRQLVDGQRAAA